MVSTAIAVFPVCLSPIISSRCPLPIGIMESIALIPVCKGVSTDFLVITPEATLSILRYLSVCMGPLPSMGWPKAFTTRPNMASPTGTSTTRPVVFTVSPSLIFFWLPRSTAPTLSSSRFSTIPYTSPGNSRSSPCIAFSRPCTRAIPSAT